MWKVGLRAGSMIALRPTSPIRMRLTRWPEVALHHPSNKPKIRAEQEEDKKSNGLHIAMILSPYPSSHPV
ncbi:hypothetical protein BDW59DRAFT_56302 [Aspergillus cavernicola]|uniref:Uncharacterized protein n=1 Tax=Aspergillus cavernicola TaxID=176166 RepID=A0ABR4IIN3_9EURO